MSLDKEAQALQQRVIAVDVRGLEALWQVGKREDHLRKYLRRGHETIGISVAEL